MRYKGTMNAANLMCRLKPNVTGFTKIRTCVKVELSKGPIPVKPKNEQSCSPTSSVGQVQQWSTSKIHRSKAYIELVNDINGRSSRLMINRQPQLIIIIMCLLLILHLATSQIIHLLTLHEKQPERKEADQYTT
jgi:hypothetical protein